MFYNFLWNDKGDKIKRKVMINGYSEGGLKMIDIASFNRSLKATWIKRYLDKENCGRWKSFFDLELEKYGGEVILTENLDIKDSRNVIKVSDPFLKETLEIWSEVKYEERILSDYHFRTLPLWYNNNSLVRAGSHFDISVSIRKTCMNRDYISISISISISTRNGTFSIFLCLCLCFCCEYFSVNRAVHKHKRKHKSFLVSGIHKNSI